VSSLGGWDEGKGTPFFAEVKKLVTLKAKVQGMEAEKF